MAFDIRNLQKGREPVRARSKADEGHAVLKYIDVDDLVPSEGNFYSMSAIEELAWVLEVSGGVKQPALVTPLGGGKYKVIAGHRRRLASLWLVQQGKEAYRKMPCIVESVEREQDEDADTLRAIDDEILLITTNSQREKNGWDKVQEATRLRALLERKRQFEKIPGETRKLIAEQLGTTPAQVGRYDSIEKHLIPAFKNCLKEGKIGISVAYELSKLPEDAQTKAASGKPITLEDVRKWKLSAEQVKKGTAEDVPPPSPARMEETEKPQGVANHHPTAEPAPEKKDTAAKQPEPPEREQPKKPDKPTGENTGKIVDFPAPPVPEPAPEPEKQTQSKRPIVAVLEDLKLYCQAMESKQGEQKQAWTESVEALSVAIVLLRRRGWRNG